MSPEPHLDTKLITAGRGASGRALAPSLHPSAAFAADSFDDARRRASTLRSEEFYGRFGSPTVRALEASLAELEGGADAMVFASGMGAFATAVLSLASAGQHIVATRQLYGASLAFLQGPCQRFGIDVTFVDGTQPGAMAAAVEAGRTVLVIAESPSNPLLSLVDLDELGAITGPFTLVDSTFATPLAQNPLAHGVDIVLHSATKGIDGHNDATLGVLVAEQDLIEHFWAYGVLHGATASPHDCWSVQRGLRTMSVRTERQTATAMALATWLDDHAAVDRVHYPGLTSHPQHELAVRQMHHFGTVLAFDLTGGLDAARRLIDGVELIRRATSLGGPETIICHPATTVQGSLTPDELEATGVTPGTVRISVGLEHVDDIIADLGQGLQDGIAAQAGSRS